MSATINGIPVDFGCIIEGHWGQYGPDRLADIAEGFGWPYAGTDGDPRAWREAMDSIGEDRWDNYFDAADHVEWWLNDHAVGCYVDWRDGECYIVPAGRERFDFGRSVIAGTPTATCRECGVVLVAWEDGDLDDHECEGDW